MTPDQYVKNAIRTESQSYSEIASRLCEKESIRLLHAAVGLQTEAGEFADPLKKFVFYGKEYDRTNLAEELSDMMWYIAIACDELGVDLEQLMKTNIEKLQSRFPEKFDSNQAINRDLDKEKQVLEQGFNDGGNNERDKNRSEHRESKERQTEV